MSLNRQNINDSAKQKLRACAARGLFKHTIPTALTGAGDNYQALANAYFALGKLHYDTGLILSVNAHMWGSVFPIMKYGHKHQQTTWLHPLLSGEKIGGHAITESGAGSDIDRIETIAEKVSSGFIVNGAKKFVTNASIADCLLVYAQSESGLSAFIVGSHDQGVKFVTKNNLSGFKNSPIGEVILDRCLLPEDRLLGTLGAGKSLMQSTLEHERAFLFAGIAGVLEQQLEQAIRFVRQRKIGKNILANCQTISHRLVTMRTRIDTIKLWVNHCAALCDQNKRITVPSSQLKILASEFFLASTSDAIQIFGAASLEEEMIFGDLLLDAAASRLLSGTNEIQHNIIASLIGIY